MFIILILIMLFESIQVKSVQVMNAGKLFDEILSQDKDVLNGDMNSKENMNLRFEDVKSNHDYNNYELIESDYESNADEIKNLPGLSFKIKFRQYSGYLDAPNGKHLFYWFVESQYHPEKAPVVLWLNGGPGCSSLYGLFNQIGPFFVRSDGKTLYKNKNSWNKVANLLFLETPAGTGFSYKDDMNYTTNDDQTAMDNFVALKNFFQKYPRFSNNKFYIAGKNEKKNIKT